MCGKVLMNNQDFIAALLENYLCLLSRTGYDHLINYSEKELGYSKEHSKLIDMMNMNSEELKIWINKNGDIEDIVKYINIYLIKQRFGLIDKNDELSYKFDNTTLGYLYAWIIYRHMCIVGYDNVENREYMIDEGEVTTSIQQIKEYFDNNETLIEINDEFAGFLMNLNMIGPNLQKFNWLPKVYKIIDNILYDDSFENIVNIDFYAWITLLSDLKISQDKSWPNIKKILGYQKDGISNYGALILGLRMYGDVFKNELQDMEIVGGHKLLYKLSVQ